MKNNVTISSVIATIFAASVYAAPVNINTATATEIANSLSGIGMRKAEAIVQYRNQNGQFNEASDVVLVKGIGKSTFIKNKTDILIK